MKHQPGPWYVCGNGKCTCKTVSCDDYPIAIVTHGPWGDDYPAIRLVSESGDKKAEAYMEQITYGEIGEELARANALLIAAAPDLLATVRAIRDAIANCGDQPICAWAGALNNVINKAEHGDTAREAKLEENRRKLVGADK